MKILFNYISANVTIKGNNNYIFKSKIVGNLYLDENIKIYSTFISGNLEIGRFTSISGPNTSILSSAKGNIKIGAFCSIARGVQIQEYNHKYNRASTYYFGQNVFKRDRNFDIESKGDIVIEDDVWIGANSIILTGVTIGRGAIIAAGSVVNKSIEPYTIVGGVPAKVIKKRFSDDVIEELEESKWWEWSYEKILQEESFFTEVR